MKLDLDKLEVVADEATPGPWVVGKHYFVYEIRFPDPDAEGSSRWRSLTKEDGYHMSVFDPSTVKALIARAREADRLESTLAIAIAALNDARDWAGCETDCERVVDEALAKINSSTDAPE